jgi:RNA polymerase primary sigma factor
MNRSDSLNRYFESIQDLNPLTREQEQELAVKIKEGCRASINTLVQHNLKIVVTIANRNVGRGILIDDLIQQGNIGLYEAALRFDPEHGVKFTSFARTRILKKMNELIDQCGRLVRIPVNQEYDRYLAIKSGKEVKNLAPVRLDSLISDDSKETLESRFKVDVADEGELERMQTLHAALGVLTEQEREVITLFFGLETGEKITQIEIGKRLGVTNVTVGNIKKRALEKIKKCYN